MKLTKLQRHTAYIIMIEEYDNIRYGLWGLDYKHCFGLCHTINCLFGLNNNGIGRQPYDKVLFFFPELLEKYHGEKLDDSDYNIEKRKIFLQRCIEETY